MAGFYEPEEGRILFGMIVKTGLGVTTFEAAPGRKVTVTVREGRPSCVVGGWFGLK